MTIRTRLAELTQEIATAAQASGRSPEAVTLLAVSKLVPPEQLYEASLAGQHVFGENYVQEAERKRGALLELSTSGGHACRFHLIGALQRNKVKRAIQLFELIHTVDRIALAEELSRAAAAEQVAQDVLLQVNVSREESKSGVLPEDLEQLCRRVLELPGLRLRGLMSIGTVPDAETAAPARAEFRLMRELRSRLEQRFSVELPELSMGMSADFAAAIEEGATIVRVGTALFGPRV